MIRFHKLKCPGKEIFEVTIWGTRNKILPVVVAVSWISDSLLSELPFGCNSNETIAIVIRLSLNLVATQVKLSLYKANLTSIG